MVNSFVDQKMKETIIDVAIITFGEKVELHTPYTPVADLQAKGISRFHAEGGTPLGCALTMAKDMIEDKATTPSNIYKPAVLLLSDGRPNPKDDWRNPLKAFITAMQIKMYLSNLLAAKIISFMPRRLPILPTPSRNSRCLYQ